MFSIKIILLKISSKHLIIIEVSDKTLSDDVDPSVQRADVVSPVVQSANELNYVQLAEVKVSGGRGGILNVAAVVAEAFYPPVYKATTTN